MQRQGGRSQWPRLHLGQKSSQFLSHQCQPGAFPWAILQQALQLDALWRQVEHRCLLTIVFCMHPYLL